MIFTSRIPLNQKLGTGIVDYLASRFTYHSVEKWHEIVSSGAVSRNGSLCSSDEMIGPGDVLCYDAGEFEEPPANLDYSIVYEDEWILGINKPGDLLVHRAGRSFRNNLIYQLRHVHQPPHAEATSVHRLDRETSGVVLVAKNTEVVKLLNEFFRDRTIAKKYVAIVHGTPKNVPMEINAPIGKEDINDSFYRYRVDPDGKEAATLLESARPLGEKYSLVTLVPHTGRTHQLRVHCAHIGHPIVGDKMYSIGLYDYDRCRVDPDFFTEKLMLPRHALHCASLTFTHPYTSTQCTIEAPLPEDMSSFLL